MLDDARNCGLRGATGETFRGVKNKKESSLGSSTPQLPFASKGGGRIQGASRSPPGRVKKASFFRKNAKKQ